MIKSLKHRNGENIMIEMNVVNEGKKYRGCLDIADKLIEDIEEGRENVYCFSELDGNRDELEKKVNDGLKYDDYLYYTYTCGFDCCSDSILYAFYEGSLTPLEQLYRTYKSTAERYRDILKKFSK